MNLKLKSSSLFFLSTFCSTVVLAEIEHDFGSHGYFRVGTGFSDGDATLETFKAPGAGAKYRLGNESDDYLELDLYDTMRMSPEGPYVHVEGMVILASDEDTSIEFDRLTQLYMEAGDFTSVLGNPKIWIGRRFYDRHDIHINDFFFLNTLQDFDAAGIRDMDIGFGKLALALGRKNADNDDATAFDESSIKQTRFDARLSDIAVNNNGTITLWGSYDSSGGDGSVEELDGYAVGIMHTQQEFFGGFNKFMVQYGRGLGRHAGLGGVDDATGTVTSPSAADDFDDAETFRVTNNNVIEVSPNWSLGTALVYEDKDSKAFDGTDQTWVSLGIRPYWFITDHFRIPLELGWDYVDDNAADTDGSLFKATVAAEFALERGFWERPVLRVFATHAQWSDEFKGEIGGDTYADETDGWSVGVQAETWW